jgi:hypothetical protein
MHKLGHEGRNRDHDCSAQIFYPKLEQNFNGGKVRVVWG